MSPYGQKALNQVQRYTAALDWLGGRQPAIEKICRGRSLEDDVLVLYDLTASTPHKPRGLWGPFW